MRVLVSGASGHLGSYVTTLFAERGHDVTALVRPGGMLWRIPEVEPQVNVIQGDLSNIERVSSEILAAAPEVVIHLAWYGVAGEYRDDPAQIYCNVAGSLKLMQLARQSGCRCWIGMGSQAEYGPREGVLREGMRARPVTAYGTAKLCVGLLTRELCRAAGLRYVWLRLLATYGPKDDVRHLIPMVTLKLLAGQRPALTAGEQRWDYLYAEDAAEAIYHLAFASDAQGVFNLGSGRAERVREIVERIRELIDPSLPLGFGELAYPPQQIMHLQADVTRLGRSLGWRPRIELEEGLRRTVDWYRENRSRYA